MAHGRKILEPSRRLGESVFRFPRQIWLLPLDRQMTVCIKDAKDPHLLLLLDAGLQQ